MKVLPGMNAVVTGAGSGIGRSIALALAERGVNVVVSDIQEEPAAAVAGEVAARNVRGIGMAVDVSRRDQVEDLARHATTELGDVQILVNNAGVTLIPFRASWDTTIEDYRWVMGVNFWGVVHGHLAFLPRMLESAGEKHIVNTSSMAVTKFTAGAAAYAAAKSATDGLTHTLRAELADRGIGVSTLHPGKVRTGILTSEKRLRERGGSSERDVPAWGDDYMKVVFSRPPEAGDPAVPSTFDDYIAPEAVGWITVRGIEMNLPRILTHPWPSERLHAIADDFERGIPDYAGWAQRIESGKWAANE